MTYLPLDQLPDVILYESDIIEDRRGYLLKAYHEADAEEVYGITKTVGFKESELLVSHKHVLRGLHYNVRWPIGRWVRTICGETFIAVVDMRDGSPTLGMASSATLSMPQTALWVPPGFALGLFATQPSVTLFETTSTWKPGSDRVVKWSDPYFDIDWPPAALISPILSERDTNASLFHGAGYVPASVWNSV